MQLQMSYGPELNPLPEGARHYLPVLQMKAGELTALRSLSPDAWKRSTPMIRVFATERRTSVSRTTAKKWNRKIQDSIGVRPFYLDLADIAPSHQTTHKGVGQQTLEFVYEDALSTSDWVVPVFRTQSTKSAQIAAIRAALDGGRGMAIVHQVLSVVPAPGQTHSTILSAVCDDSVPPGKVDLVVDLGFIDPDVEIDRNWFADSLEEICALPWRNLVVAGSSIPRTMSCVDEGTVGAIKRAEWQLWNDLTNRKLKRQPGFGDFAIQSRWQAGLKGGPGMRANIRYTVGDNTLVSRGTGPLTDLGSFQYHELSKKLVEHPDFLGPDFSWGGLQIFECSKGGEAGNQTRWRAAGTSQHIEAVTQALANIA